MGSADNLASLLDEAAAQHPARAAIVHAGHRIPYPTLDAHASRVAHTLVSRGIQPGDMVALSCPNVPFFTIAYYGILKSGATVVPLNVLLKAREITYHLVDSGAKTYLCFEDSPELPVCAEGYQGFLEAPDCSDFLVLTADVDASASVPEHESLASLMASQPGTFATARRDGDDTAVILYTSGTTGQSKGAELRHRNLRDNALLSASVFGSDATAPDTYLCGLPLFHSYGQTCIQNSALAYGGTIVMLPRWDARTALEVMAAEGVTFFAGVPTMFWQLLTAVADSSDTAALSPGLRVAASGGAALPVEIHQAFHSRYGLDILEGYGLSETSPVASFTPFGDSPRPGSIGRPVAGVEMRLIDGDWSDVNADNADPAAIGEVAIRGHNVMKGYFNRPEATAEVLRDGWFRTGDLARRDSDGWYYIVDRSKDMIIRGGYNVYPREIEELLMTHPAVSLAAVVGIPHASHGEEVKAFVILRPGATATEDDLVTWCRGRLANYKYPRAVEFVSDLPMTATGKILKRQLAR